MTRTRRATGRKPRRYRFLTLSLIAIPPIVAALGLAGWVVFIGIDRVLIEKFEGRRWDFPSKVFSDVYPVFPGLRVDGDGFKRRLAHLGYREVASVPARRGEYRRHGRTLDLYLNAFDYPTHHEAGRLLRIDLDARGTIARIAELPGEHEIHDAMLEPGLITGLHGDVAEDRREMKLDEVPVPLVRAVITVEDRRFFEHNGLDFRGLLRALVVNVKAGGIRQGGSTLTQQLMKNFFLTEARTFARKAREAAMALAAERRYSKLEILENYMNEIYMGQRRGVGIHGMWEAAQYYFGREPRELSLGQIATLAGMIRAPNYYSPHAHPERALGRRNTVLKLLYDEGETDEATYAAAVAEPLGAVPPPPPTPGSPYFVDYVRRELAARFSSDVLTSEGYSIFTTLDADLQSIAERAVSKGLEELERSYPRLKENADARLEAALIALNPRTGAVLAMIGGRDYGRSQYNRVTDARRQPGSVFKPIVYVAALGSAGIGSAHYRPTTFILDEPFVWQYEGSRTWAPANYKDHYRGTITVRDGLVFSLNAATARIAREVGLGAVRDLAVRLGIDGKMPAYPAIVLGSWEVSPLEVARVYGVLANAGLSAAPLAVSKVVDRGGHVIEGHRIAVERKLPAADAYLVTHLLEEAIDRGTGRAIRTLGFDRPAAGKTGTTNDYNDAWFAGYTPNLLTVVWVGFDRDEKLGLSGSSAAIPIWTAFMKDALEPRPVAKFEVPPGIAQVDIDRTTAMLATRGCRDVVREAFLEGEQPDDYCDKHGSGWLWP